MTSNRQERTTRSGAQTPATPEEKDPTLVATGAQTPDAADAGDARPGNTAKEAAVAASDLEAAPASQTDPQGTSFYNPALTGSGTIMPDGTYGSPLPDPNLVRRQEDPEVTTELDVPEGANTSDGSDKPAQTAAARKRS
jgi:hypothetical protein